MCDSMHCSRSHCREKWSTFVASIHRKKSGKCANTHAWDLVRAIPQHSQAAMSLNNPNEEQESKQKIDMAIMEVVNAATRNGSGIMLLESIFVLVTLLLS